MWISKIFKKNTFKIGDAVKFKNNVFTCDLTGFENVISKGIYGLITNINVDMADYKVKYYPNYEITYGSGEVTLLMKKTVDKSLVIIR